MFKKLMKVLLGILIAIAAVILAFVILVLIGRLCGVGGEKAEITADEFLTTFDYSKQSYVKAKLQSEENYKALEHDLIIKISSMDTATFSDTYELVTKNMEKCDFKSPKVRDALDARITEFLKELLANGEFKRVGGICMEVLDSPSYYHTPRNLLTEKLFADATKKKTNDILTSGNFDAVMEYLKDISTIVKYVPSLNAKHILPENTLFSLLTKDAEYLFAEDGIGGYYDSRKSEYKNSHNTVNSLGYDVAKTSTIYCFYGDFMTKDYSKQYIRENGTDLEESQLSKYDETHYTLYCRGETLSNADYQYFYKVRNMSNVYRKNDYYFAINDTGIICFNGKVKFCLLYEPQN